MPPIHKTSKPRPSEIAADTKRNFIPLISAKYADTFPPYSTLYSQPVLELSIKRYSTSTQPPIFVVESGDPAMKAIEYSHRDTENSLSAGGARIRVPLICTANERRPGGDWETGSHTYEERLCRRSNLAATLNSPWPTRRNESNYPIPSTGGILSDAVVLCRAADENYQKLEHWYDLPVISVPPTRWPKLKDNGLKYSFAEERDLIRDKMRGALRICLHNGYNSVVIGDFGLGNAYRNPPTELAEMWREIFLFDPDLRGQFRYVAFVFEDVAQSTSQLIMEETLKKEKKNSKALGKPAPPVLKMLEQRHVPDMAIFAHTFHAAEIERILRQPDPRYNLHMITC